MTKSIRCEDSVGLVDNCGGWLYFDVSRVVREGRINKSRQTKQKNQDWETLAKWVRAFGTDNSWALGHKSEWSIGYGLGMF